MSTAAPEAPVTEQAPAAPEIIIETPPVVVPEKPLWGNIKVGEKPAAEKPAETTPEVKKQDEVTPEKKVEAAKGSREESLSNLRKKLEEREKELEDYRTKYSTVEKEYNEFKTKPVEIPEEFKTKLTKAEQEREEYLGKLRAFDIQQDPKFVEQHVKPIEARISMMQRIALEAGVDEAALKAGFGRWDKQVFGEWLEGMDAGQKALFTAAWGEAELLETQRLAKLKDSNKTWEEMSQAREQEARAQHEARMSDNEKLANGLVKKLILDNESTKDFEDLPGVAEAVAKKVARFEVTPQEVMEAMISNQALARMHGKKVEELKEKTEKIAELEKKLAEQDAFIKEHAGSTPRPDATGIIPKGGEKPPALWDVRVQAR